MQQQGRFSCAVGSGQSDVLAVCEVAHRVEQALADVDALHLRSREPHTLSGGEKRRVAIATVLAMTPSILVMDEPTAGLDPRARRQLIALLKSFSHTMLIATHDMDMIYELCERTIILNQGRVMADGPTTVIFTDLALLEDCGLEQPTYMRMGLFSRQIATSPAAHSAPEPM